MQTNLPALLSPHALLTWIGWFSFFFYLFWNYLPFALAAKDLTAMTKKYS